VTTEQDRLAYALATLRRAAEHGYPWSIYPAEAAALVAEVERLRAEVERERAAVTAWLRTRERQIENWPPGGMNEISLTYNIIANVIERGEHRREEDE